MIDLLSQVYYCLRKEGSSDGPPEGGTHNAGLEVLREHYRSQCTSPGNENGRVDIDVSDVDQPDAAVPPESPPNAADSGTAPPSPGPPPLEHAFDGEGRDMWVQTRDELGRPQIWYTLNNRGTKFKRERRSSHVFCEVVTEIPGLDISP